MTAAIRAAAEGASVGLFEKRDQVGGTAAWSGGMVWIPNNPHQAGQGISDSPAEVLTYLHSLSLGTIDDDAVQPFVEVGPEMVRWMEANTPVQFTLLAGFPDYHPENPGGKPNGGRWVEGPACPSPRLREMARRGSKVPTLAAART